MKNLKKIAALVLTASMVFSMTGCAGGKLSAKKLTAAAKKMGAEQYKDMDDFEDLDEDEIEDGVYITASGKDAKHFLKDNDLTEDFYDDSIKNVTIFAIGEEEDYEVLVLNFTFSSKKDAEDFFDDRVDEFEDYCDNDYAEHDDGEENGISYDVCVIDAGYLGVTAGAYWSGNTVVVVYGVAEDVDDAVDAIDDIASCYDIVLPSEL